MSEATTENSINQALIGLKSIVAANRTPGVAAEKQLVNTVTELYKHVHAQNAIAAINGVRDFGAEHGAVFVAFCGNDDDYEDSSKLTNYPLFFDAAGQSLATTLDAMDHEDDPRMQAWIETDRDPWIIAEITPGTANNPASDAEVAAFIEQVDHVYSYRCAALEELTV